MGKGNPIKLPRQLSRDSLKMSLERARMALGHPFDHLMTATSGKLLKAAPIRNAKCDEKLCCKIKMKGRVQEVDFFPFQESRELHDP